VYKTYLDVVHVGKNDTVKTFTTAGGGDAAAGDAQRAAASIFDSGDLGREEIEAKEAAMVVCPGACGSFYILWSRRVTYFAYLARHPLNRNCAARPLVCLCRCVTSVESKFVARYGLIW